MYSKCHALCGRIWILLLSLFRPQCGPCRAMPGLHLVWFRRPLSEFRETWPCPLQAGVPASVRAACRTRPPYIALLVLQEGYRFCGNDPHLSLLQSAWDK